ncbi:hypothetical protein AMC91_10130 [Elizabethkingia miricola]|nr:hypothetical protein AMC91_10130 [Elizabethkingia miricola]
MFRIAIQNNRYVLFNNPLIKFTFKTEFQSYIIRSLNNQAYHLFVYITILQFYFRAAIIAACFYYRSCDITNNTPLKSVTLNYIFS